MTRAIETISALLLFSSVCIPLSTATTSYGIEY